MGGHGAHLRSPPLLASRHGTRILAPEQVAHEEVMGSRPTSETVSLGGVRLLCSNRLAWRIVR
jgi:hypothetical protein